MSPNAASGEIENELACGIRMWDSPTVGTRNYLGLEPLRLQASDGTVAS